MIRARGLGKAVGDRWLFRQLQFHWTAGDRVGIVGPNGSGKSTFFRLLLGRDSPTEGELHRRKDLVMGYLPQELPAAGKGTVLEEVLAAAPDLLELEQTLDQISLALRRSPGDESLLKQWGEIQSRLDARQSWNREEEARSMLSSLGFSEEQVTMPYASLSGGWRMRVRLAGLLVQKPEALLLDEPTNHLDLDGVLWLERFLASWQGLLLLVSHDRALLDRIATQILWFAPEGALLRKGNFSRVEEHRRQIRDHQLAAWKHQQKQRLATERFIDRFRAKNTKASQVQSRIRYLDRLEPIAEPEGDPDEPRIRIPAPSRGPLRLIRLEGAGKTFGERVIYSRVDFTLERGEKIALTGPNGSGKSTLLKLLAGKENLTSGDRRVGPDVRLGYYAQHHEENLDPDQTVLESLASVAPEWGETALRSHLGAFRFTGDNVHKRVGILSGGEQARLVLARLLAQPAHALLLDEPTNHLDLMTREALQTALADYPGALVLISHDRTLLDTVTSTTVAVRNGALRIYQGTISDYLRNQEQNREPPGPVPPGPTSSTRAREFRERRRRNNRLKTLDRLLREKERELREVVTQLEDPVRSSDYEALISLQTTKESLEETILELLLEQETLRQDNR